MNMNEWYNELKKRPEAYREYRDYENKRQKEKKKNNPEYLEYCRKKNREWVKDHPKRNSKQQQIYRQRHPHKANYSKAKCGFKLLPKPMKLKFIEEAKGML